MDSLKSTIETLGFGILALLVLSYLAYMLGLILVLKRLNRLNWMAFVPLLNYYAQIRAIGAPARWFLFSLPPYLGAVYVGAVAVRLGRVFGRGPAFSLTWLTLGAPVGMFILARSKAPLDLAVLDEPAGLVDLKQLKLDRARAKRH